MPPPRPLPALLVAGALALPAAPAAAQGAVAPAGDAGARAHVVDRARSRIGFVARSRLGPARGAFERWEADVRLDVRRPERSSVRVTIDAASVNTGIGRRDRHLRGPDFFDVAAHPTITFVSTSVARTGPAAGVITGELTVRGVTRTVRVPVTMLGYEGGRGRFEGAFTLDRRDYGVSYGSRLNPIRDEVAVRLEMTVTDPRAGG